MKTRCDERRVAVLSPLDAWVLARLWSGQPIDEAASEVSPGLRPVVEELGPLSGEERVPILTGFSLAQADQAAFIRAVGDMDPCRPRPSAEEQRAWEQARRGPELEARLIMASEVEEAQVEWLWPGRIPLGMLTLFSGDPKLGKSLTTLSLTASMTTGRPLPCGSTAPRGSAVLLSAEDDLARTIKPRLRVAGADLGRVGILSSIVEPQLEGPADDPAATVVHYERMPTLFRHDLKAIEKTAEALGDCRLIVIDPVSAFLADCDDHRSANLRGILTPLKEMAERLGAAVVLITHHNKGGAGVTNGKYRVLGSIAYVGACRANFLFLPDPDDPEGRRVLMLDNGGNIGPKQPGLAYVIRDEEGVACCDWQEGTVDLDADAALAKAARAAKGRESGGKDNRSQKCEEWLEEYLGSGMKPVEECERDAVKAGYSRATLFRARNRLGVSRVQVRVGGKVVAFWTLADESDDPPAASSPS